MASKFAAFQKNLVGAQRDGVRAGALLVTTSVRRELARAAPSGRLSGVGRRGARLSVGFDAPRSTSNPVALVRARGPWQLIENRTRAHTIVAKRRRRAQTRRAAVLTPAGPRASVNHPGTRGKHPWERGVRVAEPRILPTMQAEVHAAMVKAFR